MTRRWRRDTNAVENGTDRLAVNRIIAHLHTVNKAEAAKCHETGPACCPAAKSLPSCPTLCDPIDAAHQASPSLGSSRQEHWSGLPFSPPMRESEVTQSCLTLCNPMDCSLPSSSIHGIFQARVLERGATAFRLPQRWLICNLEKIF